MKKLITLLLLTFCVALFSCENMKAGGNKESESILIGRSLHHRTYVEKYKNKEFVVVVGCNHGGVAITQIK